MEERAKDIASAFVSHVQRMVSLRGGDDFFEGVVAGTYLVWLQLTSWSPDPPSTSLPA